MKPEERIRDELRFLYGAQKGEHVALELHTRIEEFQKRNPQLRQGAASFAERLTERDTVLITYGDQVKEPGRRPLQVLGEFLEQHVSDVVGGIHLLPHFPYSSDDGFSVIDYRKVNPELGDWDDVAHLRRQFRLMFDGVINHISRQSAWFHEFVRGKDPYTNYFIVADPSKDFSMVVRPRTLPLLTPVETADGVKHVWTTFSEDQIDLNYKNPQVLLEIIDLLLFYAERGAEVIRLDAIAYLWKEPGTPCIHLPQTHSVIRLFRAVFDALAPGVMLITETNVPHKDNISYFGDGTNEAQLVYNFALPPLVLHAFHTGNADTLSRWAAGLKLPSDRVSFFNFLASHDGIGINPARGILSDSEIDALVERVQLHGGFVSYKHNPDGSQSPYELNVNYFDALSNPSGEEPLDLQVARFLAAQAIMLSLVGVPGIYFHSLFGSRGWSEGVKQTGRNRTINRQKFGRATLDRELADPIHLRRQVFAGYKRLLKARCSSRAFHPTGQQSVIPCGNAVFAVLRRSPDGNEVALCLHNVSKNAQTVKVDWQGILVRPSELQDLIAAREPVANEQGALHLEPYQTMWLAGRPALRSVSM